MSAGMADEIDGLIEKAADLIELKAAAFRENSASAARFSSEKLNKFLAESEELIFMGITGGIEVADEITRLQKEKKMTEAVVIDVAAGEIVDAGFEWLASLYRRELSRESCSLTKRRFSAGYGDFNIEFQRDIFKILSLDKLNVEITDSCMLLPEKTVTAVYGIVKGNN